jgi:hypothetical protein
MGEIYALPTWTNHCQADAISALEDVLARAKAGELTSVAIAATTTDLNGHYTFSEQVNGLALLGVITLMRDDLASDLRRERA